MKRNITCTSHSPLIVMCKDGVWCGKYYRVLWRGGGVSGTVTSRQCEDTEFESVESKPGLVKASSLRSKRFASIIPSIRRVLTSFPLPTPPRQFFALAPIRTRSKFEDSATTRIFRRETLASHATRRLYVEHSSHKGLTETASTLIWFSS